MKRVGFATQETAENLIPKLFGVSKPRVLILQDWSFGIICEISGTEVIVTAYRRSKISFIKTTPYEVPYRDKYLYFVELDNKRYFLHDHDCRSRARNAMKKAGVEALPVFLLDGSMWQNHQKVRDFYPLEKRLKERLFRADSKV